VILYNIWLSCALWIKYNYCLSIIPLKRSQKAYSDYITNLKFQKNGLALVDFCGTDLYRWIHLAYSMHVIDDLNKNDEIIVSDLKLLFNVVIKYQ